MRIPDNIYINICKLFQEIYKNRFQLDAINVVQVGSRGNPMHCRYMLEPPDGKKELTFSYYDAVVQDAVYTIYQSNVFKFTLNDVIRVMTGDERVRFYATKDTVQKREQRLLDAMDRLMHTGIVIDYTEEVQMRGLTDADGQPLSGMVTDYLLPVVSEKNGKVYHFLEGRKLPLYKYAEEIRQIICVPKELLMPEQLLKQTCPDFLETEAGRALTGQLKFSNTDEIILLKRILIQRLEVMRNAKNHVSGRRIRYYGSGSEDGIFPMADIRKENFAQEKNVASERGSIRTESRGWKNKVHQVNQKICAILDAYQKCGYLEAYKLLKNEPRGLVRGIEIVGAVTKTERLRS